MPRPRGQLRTKLGAELVARRGEASLESVSGEMSMAYQTLSRLERGTHRPSADTARALARWLGWTTDQVLDAADQPAPSTEPTK